jgi:iron complex outermembrane receptor protein
MCVWKTGLRLLVALLPVVTIAAAAEDLLQLEEVTVTGRRVAESRATVGASVVVLDGAFLDDYALNAPDDLHVAGVKFGAAGITDVQSIRGMQSGVNFGMEQSAPCFLDGVWFGSSRCARTSLLDLAQLEVLKGPQPTYYGKGAIAGAFVMTSRKPSGEFSGELTAFHKVKHNETALGGALNMPLGSRMATRLAGRWRNMDGYLVNRANDRRDPRQRDGTMVAARDSSGGAVAGPEAGVRRQPQRRHAPVRALRHGCPR